MDRSSPLYRRYALSKDVLIAMLPIFLMNVITYGLRPLLLLAVSMAFSYLFDALTARMRQERFDRHDISGMVTGAILVMFLPASAPYWLAVVGVFVAIVLAKNAFGGYGNNIFNPAAVGGAFLALFWPELMFSYPLPFTNVPLILQKTSVLVDSPLKTMKIGGVPFVEKMEFLIGNYPGPLGAVGTLVVLSGAVYLFVKKAVDWRLPVSVLGACALFSYLFPRLHTTRLDAACLELLSGTLVFAAFFVVTDPITAPKQPLSRLIYGALFGVITMLFRYYGAFEMGVCFAAIASNAMAAFIDRKVAWFQNRNSGLRMISQ